MSEGQVLEAPVRVADQAEAAPSVDCDAGVPAAVPRERPAIGVLRARSLFDLLALRVAPGLAAGGIAALHSRSPWLGVVVAVAVVTANSLLDRARLPLHLMPLGRLVMAALLPLAALAVVLLSGMALGSAIGVEDVLGSAIGAWVMLGVGTWMRAGFQSDRQVRVAVIGSPRLAAALAEEIEAAGIAGYRVVGSISTGAGAENGTLPSLGSLGDIRGAVASHGIDLLVHSSSPSGGDAGDRVSRLEVFERVAAQCLDLPVRMIEAGNLYEDLLGHVPIGQINAAWFQYILHPRFRGGSPLSKRVFDLALTVALGVVAAPALVVAALAVKLNDGGRVLYRQRRIGEGGRSFEILKLRTMREGAQDEAPRWSSADDERVTRVGRVLRRLHVDELPQLWNVLRGEMTFVGPRPEQPEIVGALEQRFPHYEPRHIVKPGITGWAQVRCGYAGTDVGAAFKLCHDLYYLKHRSLIFDALICLETLRTAGYAAEFDVEAPAPQFILEPSAN